MGIPYDLFVHCGSILQSEKPFLVTGSESCSLFEVVRFMLAHKSYCLQVFLLGETDDARISRRIQVTLLTILSSGRAEARGAVFFMPLGRAPLTIVL